MTFSRSVVIQKSSAKDYDSELHALIVVLTGIGPLDTNPDAQHDTDSIEASEALGKKLDLLAQQLGTEDVSRCFQAALAEAAEEVEAIPEETAVPERLEILVKHIKIKFAEAGLTPHLERALESTVPEESRVAVLSRWARSGLDQVLRCGKDMISGTLYLLPFVTLLGMATPVGTESDGLIDEVVGGAVTEEAVDLSDDFALAVRDWWSAYGVMTMGTLFAYNALLMSFIVYTLKNVPVRDTPRERRRLQMIFPSGFHNRAVKRHVHRCEAVKFSKL
eukprot:Blabericola_migrator_1__6170@NODE_3112_length_2029_cov_8_593782_g1949_i0_p1_GENE_NODE_3112_length_2029_cov_8_593782_g1949_i0NODE_3112_length_2029_cov_8_593782_g1949_i0_p1_ORF_typecomplete_len277_score46_65RsbU_N/PF08673_10/0_23_NODE_3112_length_2029_cov_8_593782_g1949_i010311861